MTVGERAHANDGECLSDHSCTIPVPVPAGAGAREKGITSVAKARFTAIAPLELTDLGFAARPFESRTDLGTVELPRRPSPAQITAHNDVSCFEGTDGQCNCHGGRRHADYTYLWSDGQTSSTAPRLKPGSYTVTVTDTRQSPRPPQMWLLGNRSR